MAEDDLHISIRQIEPGDQLTGLSLGKPEFEPLKRFLRQSASIFHTRSLAKTYGVFASDRPVKLIAYITLVCGEIETKTQIGERLGDEVKYEYDHCPAVKIARLAVDRRFSKNGIGKTLVEFSLGLVTDEISPRIGCRFVVVDAKKSAVDFYARKCGFTFLDTAENRELDSPIMFIDLYKAAPPPASAELREEAAE